MSQEKAQLIAPIDSSFTVPGLTVSGVITATSFDGTITGVADSITQGNNLNVGVVTALSFAGNLSGNAGGLTGSPNTVAGVVTATSFVGGLTGNITGDVIGNATGVGASIKQGVNLNVGIATAWKWYGDGSSVTGVAGSAFAAQEVTATGDETILNLTHGNLIYYKGVATTVGFASTAATQEISIVKDTNSTFTAAYNESFSTGGVTLDGNDYLSIPNNAAFQLGTDDWTIECFWKSGSGNTGNYQQLCGTQAVFAANNGIWRVGTRTSSNQIYFSRADGSGFEEPIWDVDVNDEEWYHLAFTRESGYVYCYVDGVKQTNVGESNNITGTMTTSNAFWVGYNGRDGTYNTGTVSNLRIVKGTAVYTANFLPPSAALTNVTNTALLCCQSDSSATASTVSAGTITANGDPAAGAQTVAYSGTNTLTSGAITWPDRITWNRGTTPTLVDNPREKAFQIFRFLSVDSGLTYTGWEEMKNNAETSALFAWGQNYSGQNMQNNVIFRSSPTQVGTDNTWDKDNVTVSKYYFHAIKSDGTAWTGGGNNSDNGILGLNNTVNYSSPTQLSGSWSRFEQGNNWMSGIKTGGTAWTWGQNDYGQLGLNTQSPAPPGGLSSPTQVGTDTDWANIGLMGSRTGFGVKTNGSLWVWGDATLGGLGLNAPVYAHKSSPTQIPGTWAATSSAGPFGYVGAAIQTNGTLWTWGLNSSGQLGQNKSYAGSTPAYGGLSSPTQVGTDATWSEVRPLGNAMMALKTDNTIWMWGSNTYGALGQNNLTQYSSPVQVPGTTWSTISGAYKAGGAIKTDGTLWTWGNSDDGMGGRNYNNPTGGLRSSPTQIPGTNWSSIHGGAYSRNMMATKMV